MQFYNDLSQLPEYFFYALGLFIVYTCSIIMHELGHNIMFWYYGIKSKVSFHKQQKGKGVYFQTGSEEDYKRLSDGQYKRVVWVGILLGIIPPLIAGIIYSPNYLMILIYLIGCLSDIKNLNIELEE